MLLLFNGLKDLTLGKQLHFLIFQNFPFLLQASKIHCSFAALCTVMNEGFQLNMSHLNMSLSYAVHTWHADLFLSPRT